MKIILMLLATGLMAPDSGVHVWRFSYHKFQPGASVKYAISSLEGRNPLTSGEYLRVDFVSKDSKKAVLKVSILFDDEDIEGATWIETVKLDNLGRILSPNRDRRIIREAKGVLVNAAGREWRCSYVKMEDSYGYITEVWRNPNVLTGVVKRNIFDPNDEAWRQTEVLVESSGK